MKINSRFFDYVVATYQGVDLKSDVQISVDGNGDATIVWNLPGKPPSDADIAAANPPPYVPPLSVQAQLDALQAALIAAGTITQNQLTAALATAQQNVVVTP